ncbi:MAG TPA: hypothetical protein VHO03_08070 [Ignavibacteriales bacterium]|nr:hypothetical protein [Ignavibacteriales bacterium]
MPTIGIKRFHYKGETEKYQNFIDIVKTSFEFYNKSGNWKIGRKGRPVNVRVFIKNMSGEDSIYKEFYNDAYHNLKMLSMVQQWQVITVEKFTEIFDFFCEKIHVTNKDEMILYSTPNGFIIKKYYYVDANSFVEDKENPWQKVMLTKPEKRSHVVRFVAISQKEADLLRRERPSVYFEVIKHQRDRKSKP